MSFQIHTSIFASKYPVKSNLEKTVLSIKKNQIRLVDILTKL